MTEPTRKLTSLSSERHCVLNERTRCLLMLRLVQAEIDLAMLPSVISAQPPAGTSHVQAPEALSGFQVPKAEVSGQRLTELRRIRATLTSYIEALDDLYTAITTGLVSELAGDPGSCLPQPQPVADFPS